MFEEILVAGVIKYIYKEANRTNKRENCSIGAPSIKVQVKIPIETNPDSFSMKMVTINSIFCGTKK